MSACLFVCLFVSLSRMNRKENLHTGVFNDFDNSLLVFEAKLWDLDVIRYVFRV